MSDEEYSYCDGKHDNEYDNESYYLGDKCIDCAGIICRNM